MFCKHLAQNRDKRWARVKTVMNVKVLQSVGHF
jgi:hypothetical protein